MFEDKIKKYLELSNKIEKDGASSLTKEEKDLVIEYRKLDNEKILKQVKANDTYYLCDRSGSAQKFEPTEFDTIEIVVHNGDDASEIMGIKEYVERFNDKFFDLKNKPVDAVVKSRVFISYWDESKDYMEKIEKEEYVVKQIYHMAEVTCAIESKIRKA